MKQRYRDRALKDLLDRLESRDFDRREQALFELAIMLRRANQRRTVDDPLSAAELSRELSRIRLALDEQRFIVDRLIRLVVSRRESRASAFWTLSAAAGQAGWEPALRLLKACGHELDDEAAFQACRALRIWLESGELSEDLVERGIAACDSEALLRRWSERGDARLRRAARDLAKRLVAAAASGQT